MKKSLLIAMLCAWPFFAFSQNSIYVSPDGDGNGSIEDPISLIEAINMALDNDQEDVIYLQQGIYPNTVITLDYNNPSTDEESIYLSGGWDPSYSTFTEDPLLTTLNGGSGRIFSILAQNANINSVFGLYNMTLTDATVTEEHGGAIAVLGSNEATGTVDLDIESVFFLSNTINGLGYGGGIYTPGGFNIRDCYFDNNFAHHGGAIFVQVRDNTMDNERIIRFSHFENNKALHGGSTIYTFGPNLQIQDCTILGMEDGSSSGPGSGIFGYHNSHTAIDRCRFQDIRIDFWGSAVQVWNGSADIANSLFIDCESGLNNGFGAFSYYHGNGDADREIYISNCTFSGNQSQGSSFGSAIHFRGNGGDAIYIANSIFWNQGTNALYKESGSAYITHTLCDSDPLGFSIMQPMFNADPLFGDEFQIGENSPAVDVGNAEYVDENWLDYDGGIRLLGEHPDLGAHEYNAPPLGVLLPTAELTENNDINFNFTSITTDGQIGDTHVFDLIEGNGSNDADNAKFTIINDQLYINEAANYEEQDYYSVFMRATDSEGQIAETALIVDVADANDAPVFSGELEDQNGIVGEFNSFAINTDAFEDEDQGDELSFSASLENGDPLPAWLSFDPADNSLSGTPVQEEILEIMITAVDQGDQEASGTFLYNISVLGLENIQRQSIKLYPNPATDFIRIEIPEFYCNYAIYSADGKLMNEGVLQGNQKNLEVNNLPTGNYLLIIWDEEIIRTGKFLKE